MRRNAPRVPLGLLVAVWVLPREVREEVLGDLLEKWTDIESTHSGPSRFMWIWRQPFEALLIRIRLAAREPFHTASTVRPGPNGASAGMMRIAGLFSSMLQDGRIAVRSLARRPGFAALAVMTIAIGIGSSTAVFSIVDGVLLTPLPFSEPQELVMVWPQYERDSDPDRGYISQPDIESLRQSSFVMAIEGVRATGGALLTSVDPPEVVPRSIVTGGLMELLGATPALGRDLRHSDNAPGAVRVVVVSHRFWQTRLGGSSEVIGSNIELLEERVEVVGVAPPSFDYPAGTDLWNTWRLDTEQCGRNCPVYRGALARLAGGLTIEGGQAAANTVASGLSQAFPDDFPPNKSFWLESLMDYEVGDVRTGLWITLGAVGLVLLIVCANTANLLLVRASGRAREVAVRASLGASRGRLVLQVLAESVVLALGGGLLGLLLSVGILRWVEMLAGDQLPRMSDVTVDGSMMVFLLTVTSLVTVAFGLRPALHIVRHGGIEHLLSASRRGFLSSYAKGRSTVVAAEVALCIVTLAGAGLLVRSLDQLYRVDMGFDVEHVTRFSLIPPVGRYPDRADLVDFFSRVEDAIADLPGVESVGSVFGAPLGRDQLGVRMSVEGSDPDAQKVGVFRPATAGYFEAMSIPILRGRGFEGADRSAAEPVAVLNELAALQLFGPDEESIGRNIHVTNSTIEGSMRVIGIVGDVRRTTTTEPLSAVYPFFPLVDPAWRGLTVHVKTAPSAANILPAIRDVVALIDPDLVLFLPGTVSEARRQDTARTRFFMSLLSIFALTAVVLAGVGLYGVIAFLVAQRTPEIGLRMALGAGRFGLTRLVVSQGVWPTAIGLVVGLLVAILGGRVMKSLIFGVEPSGPLVLVAATALVGVVAIAANLVPTRSAMRVDPAVALRAD